MEPIAEFQGIKYKINLVLKIVMILGAGFISIAILVWFKTRVREPLADPRLVTKVQRGFEEP